MLRKQVTIDNADNLVKTNLLIRLKECVSELVVKFTSDSWVPLKNEEATTYLCWILEAVFIHGLKNTFLKSLFQTRRESNIPNPSFWDFILMVSHRDVIEEIRKLNYINSDVGRCRAWIRLTLNEMSFVSYLENMIRNPSFLKGFYKPSAFLRDHDKCDILKNYLLGVAESCRFDLVVDNSLLNQWNSGPLTLVGLWIDDQISIGVDVAQNMSHRDIQDIPQIQKPRTPEPLQVGPVRKPLLSEEEAFKILMAMKPSSNSSSRRNSVSDSNSSIHSANEIVPNEQPPTNLEIKGESIYDKNEVKSEPLEPSGTSQSFADGISSDKTDISLATDKRADVEMEAKSDMTVATAMDSDALVDTGNQDMTSEDEHGSNYDETTSEKFDSPKEGKETLDACGLRLESSDKDSSSNALENSLDLQKGKSVLDGYDIASSYANDLESEGLLTDLSKFVSRIPPEKGMDQQQYSCKQCRSHIGMSVAPAKLCHFSGCLFCVNCHSSNVHIIPSRVILNWDFTAYEVCKVASSFLQNSKDRPIYNLSVCNNKLYSFIDELTEIKVLRTKLYYVSIYLKTCKNHAAYEQFAEEFLGRTYLFESVHLYSLTDLVDVSNRSMFVFLQKSLKNGIAHIKSCKVCICKGFVCEVCRNPGVIFPFDDKIFKCHTCGATYHKHCMNHSKPCPRCQRWNRVCEKNSLADSSDEDLKLSD